MVLSGKIGKATPPAAESKPFRLRISLITQPGVSRPHEGLLQLNNPEPRALRVGRTADLCTDKPLTNAPSGYRACGVIEI
jgi:hypothetical protein